MEQIEIFFFSHTLGLKARTFPTKFGIKQSFGISPYNKCLKKMIYIKDVKIIYFAKY